MYNVVPKHIFLSMAHYIYSLHTWESITTILWLLDFHVGFIVENQHFQFLFPTPPPPSPHIQGLLDLEGSLASVLVHLVKRDQAATNMLDTFTDAQDAMNSVKERLHEMMRSEDDFNEESYSEVRMLIDVRVPFFLLL